MSTPTADYRSFYYSAFVRTGLASLPVNLEMILHFSFFTLYIYVGVFT
jgi:hypothetical protein